MKNPVITRKEVYAGELLMINSDYTLKKTGSKNKIVNEKEKNQRPFTGVVYVCRGILFNINEDELANDLIWTTPTKYLIDGVWPKVDVETKFFIQNCVKLEKLLKYQGYGIDLTQDDLNTVYNRMIAHKIWIKQHKELFGYEKKADGGYMYDGVEIIPNEIYETLSCIDQGKPDIHEPGYQFIKRRK